MAQDKYTDGVDDVLVKVMVANKKNTKSFIRRIDYYEKKNVHYQNQDNYQLPCIAIKEQNKLHIGLWVNHHRQYLKQHHSIRYYNLLTSERLYPYLADIDEQAQTIFLQFVKTFAEKENVTEKLKTDNPRL